MYICHHRTRRVKEKFYSKPGRLSVVERDQTLTWKARSTSSPTMKAA